jgi:Flp pilus assembly protein TadG
MKRDRGSAAIEMALVLTLLCTTLTLTAPLAEVFQQKIALERVAGAAARFATAVAEKPRYGVAGRRPTILEVTNKAATDWAVDFATVPLTVVLSKSPTVAHAGDQVEVTVSTNVDLGLLGSILSFANVANGTSVTVTAKAVGRQE